MCLDRVTRRHERPSEKIISVYKVIRRRKNGQYGFEYFSNYPLVFDTWMRSEPASEPYLEYPAGFHVFADRKSAEGWLCNNASLVVVRARVRRIHTVGEQWAGKVYVAEELYIPRIK